MARSNDDSTAPAAVGDVERVRPGLVGLAYRMLGSLSEAEDAVQDTLLRWWETDQSSIQNPAAWLTTVCTRRCVDVLRSARLRRVDYVGAWLPEVAHVTPDIDADLEGSLASSLSTAFLLMLERLSPRERAAYLLRDIFELPYDRIAEILRCREAACRKLVSRARAGIGQSRSRFEVPPVARQEELLSAFRDAIATGDASRFAEMLAEDVEIRHDSGGRVHAEIHVLQGKCGVVDFVERFLRRVWKRYRWTVTDLNGTRGVLLQKDGAPVTAITVDFNEDAQVAHIYILRNPDKLASLSGESIGLGRGGLA